ncbi:hypothetical protein MMC18_009360, partial [Xylographa bjoerkii]|nr:hypothetical protein [Xylographa bjoerkii]
SIESYKENHVMEIEIPFYCPEPVKKFLAVGGNSFIGLVDNSTVFKYPRLRNDTEATASLDVEARLFEIIGFHARIIGFRGQGNNGLFIEYAPHGSLAQHLLENNPTIQQRLTWAYQATEAIAVVHQKRVIHRDIKVNNLLLDAALDIKLCDFQGRLLGPNGEIKLDGGSSENPKSFMPRADSEYADLKTDIFALGSALYHIMEGHEIFPELDCFSDEEQISENFRSGQFPELGFLPMRDVVHKCWEGNYNSAEMVLRDIKCISSN